MKKFLLSTLAVSAFTFADVGPIPLELDVHAPVDLTTTTGTKVNLTSGKVAATFSYTSKILSSDKIKLTIGGESAIFLGANRKGTTIYSKAENSKQLTADGDMVGIRLANVGKEFLDEDVSVDEESCTWEQTKRVRRYVYHSHSGDGHHGHGHHGHGHHGHWQWVTVTEVHHGDREVTTTTRNYRYSYEGSISTAKAGKVATLTGERLKSKSSRSVGTCR